MSRDCHRRQEYSLLQSWALTGPLTLACEKYVLWLDGACGAVEREGDTGLPEIDYLFACLLLPPARLLHTYQWNRSKVRKLTSSSSSKTGPAVEKTARTVSPSAPSPRTLSQSWAGLRPQGDIHGLTGLFNPSPALRPLGGTGIG